MRINRQLLLFLLLLTRTAAFAQIDTSTKFTKLTGFDKKRVFGLAIVAGASSFKVKNSNWKQGAINYGDSLKSIASQSAFKFDISILYFVNFNKSFAFRPAITLSFEGSKLQYNKTQSIETVNAETVSEIVSLPFLFKVSSKNIQPYVVAGPSFLYMLRQDDKEKILLPIKTVDLMGDLGFGVDVDMPKLKLIATPEIKYSAGLLNRKGEASNLYTNTIEQLKRRAIALLFTYETDKTMANSRLCVRQRWQPKFQRQQSYSSSIPR